MTDKIPQDATMAPDPEEDDLDDLDDVLDSFQAKPAAAPTPAPATSAPLASGPGRPAAAQDGATQAPDDFTKQIQESMVGLMSELDSNPAMQAEFEQMMAQLISADAGGPGAAGIAAGAAAAGQPAPKLPAATSSATGKKEEADFQSTIRKTMERINASDSTAAASTAAAPTSEEDLLAAMMKELGGGEGGDGDFNSMLMNMMAHLTNKEILYEPMKELHDKFPAWMEKNAEKEKKEDLDRYKEQQKLVGEIVGRFERKGYKDENEDDREYIVERMQKMQAAGSPPSDLVGDMSAAQEALGDLDQGCPMQ
ncbi:related to PEX19 protein [Ramularia collo-cygni]|uniref:Related to PEX19 protein n=1 Tax=Ramularia collo-cygni TaxID=112498 RepID=A0A2D3UUH2_9PEZI|nr:related to PEX19 protein [Ramularia collo-cygni]CZT20231.1 related to PEX19 protein [Ramularia collo-cygni]